MSESVVLLFSGQGAQKVGMGSDLAAASAGAALDFDLIRVMAGGPPEMLTRTGYCQPALYLHGLARLVAARGRFMDEACETTAGSMAAMIGGEEEAVRRLAADCDVHVANLNAPGQIVLSGTAAGIARAVENAKSLGLRMAKPLQAPHNGTGTLLGPLIRGTHET
jgi:[acyl-carrier-protein] S-malonyltransferase